MAWWILSRRKTSIALGWIALLTFLLATLMLSFPAKAVSAAKGRSGATPGLGERPAHYSFVDLDEVPWAANTLEAMYRLSIVKGYGNGRFQPNRPITQDEILAMVFRALGKEHDAQKAVARGNNGHNAPGWSRGYVNLAGELGLLSGGIKYQPNKPATRAWVAAFLAAASGLPAIDDDGVSQFFDGRDIPAELRALVALAIRQGWFTGYPGKRFNPNKPITRAEVATAIYRFLCDDLVSSNLPGFHRGTLVRVDPDGDTITVRSKNRRDMDFAIDDNALILVDNELTDVSALKEGMKVVVRAVDGKAILIDAGIVGDRKPVPLRAEGHIERIVLGDVNSIVIGGLTYRVDAGAKIEDEYGRPLAFTDLRVGWLVAVYGENRSGVRVVTRIKVRATEAYRVSAVLYDVTRLRNGDYLLEFVDNDGNLHREPVSPTLPVYQIGADSTSRLDIDALAAGDTIELIYALDDATRLVRIELKAVGRQETGAIVRVRRDGTQPGLELDVGASEVFYRFAPVVYVSDTVDGKVIDDVEELSAGDMVRLTLTADNRIIIVLVTGTNG